MTQLQLLKNRTQVGSLNWNTCVEKALFDSENRTNKKGAYHMASPFYINDNQFNELLNQASA